MTKFKIQYFYSLKIQNLVLWLEIEDVLLSFAREEGNGMYMRILKSADVKRFNQITGIKSDKVFICKEKSKYYAIVDIDNKIEINKEIAILF